MAQHTPEPWIVEPINDGLTYQITTAEATGFRVIAETNWGDDGDAANARLMAAAPDAMRALREIVEWHRRVSDEADELEYLNSGGGWDHLDVIAEGAAAVIAKAEGRS